MLQIRKKDGNVWEYIDTETNTTKASSKQHLRYTNTSIDFTEPYGNDFARYDLSDIEIYDDSNGGVQVTFSGAVEFQQQLKTLGNPAFYEDADIVIADLVSLDASNILILGTDGKLYVNVNSSESINESLVVGDIFESLEDSGDIDLDYGAYSLFIITLSGAAQFINVNLPAVGKTIVRNMLLSGGSFTEGEGWIESPNSDTYDSSKVNSITLNIYNSETLGAQVRYSIENLEATADFFDVVAELGQSNMEGRDGDTGNGAYPFTSSNGVYWNGSIGVDISTDRGGATDGSHANYFAEEYYSLTGRKAVMVEASQGGTGLTSTASATNWSSGSTLRSSAETLINGALTAYNKALPKAALWCQGERDAQEMDSNGSYTKPIVKAAMQDVIDWWQTTYPGVPFIISELGDTNTGANTQGWQDMRDIQNEMVTENTGVYIGFDNAKNFYDESKMSDSLHYNYTGYQEMGEALATYLANL